MNMNNEPQTGRAVQQPKKFSEVDSSHTSALADKMTDRNVLLYHQTVSNKAPASNSAMPIFPNRGFVSFLPSYNYSGNRPETGDKPRSTN